MIDLTQYGYRQDLVPTESIKLTEPTELTEPLNTPLIPGRITELQREQYTLMTQYGEITAVLKGTFYHQAEARADFPCVGDFVLLQYNENGVSRIASLLPRRTKFSRADLSGHAAGYVKTIKEQLVAANFDTCFVVSSLNLDFNLSRILRYLTQAWQSGGQPVVILTKADLLSAAEADAILATVSAAAPGVPVHAISSQTGWGMEALAPYLAPGQTVVFLGMSGVGKSSLVNALMQQEVMTVKEIRQADSRGRHTTTHRQLFMLPGGAMVIDTPGMRELGLFQAEEGVGTSFAQVEELFDQCRFHDCRHQTEPGCAVQAALAEGRLAPEQWEQYQTQQRENQFVADKTAYLRERSAWHKSLAKQIKAIKRTSPKYQG